MNIIRSKEMIFGGAPLPPTKKGGETELRVEWINALKRWEPFGCPRGLALWARQNWEVGVPGEQSLFFRAFLWGGGSVEHHGSQLPEIGKVLSSMYIGLQLHIHTQTPHPMVLHSHCLQPPHIHWYTFSHSHSCTHVHSLHVNELCTYCGTLEILPSHTSITRIPYT